MDGLLSRKCVVNNTTTLQLSEHTSIASVSHVSNQIQIPQPDATALRQRSGVAASNLLLLLLLSNDGHATR